MEQRNKNKSNAGWWLLIKLSIASLAVWFMYEQVFEKVPLRQLADEYGFIFSHRAKAGWLVVILVLMFLNWSVEAIKWKMMIAKIEQVSFLKSLEAVFSGLTISFFTPNRIGEYAGRVFHLKSADRIQATLITVVENLSQLLITIVVGSVSLLFYLHGFVKMDGYFFGVATVLIVLFVISVLLVFLNVSVLGKLPGKIKWMKSWVRYLEVFGYYSTLELVQVIGLAFLRYLIFTTQFYLLLELFDVSVSYPVALLMISMTFYVMSFVPTILLTEIGVRGAVATYFFGLVNDHLPSVINATMSLWLINLVIPALAGAVFVFMFNLEKRNTA